MADRVETPLETFVGVANTIDAFVEAKPGLKTTEFWMASIGVLATQLGALDLPGEHSKTIATVVLIAAYVLSRGVAKAGVPATSA